MSHEHSAFERYAYAQERFAAKDYGAAEQALLSLVDSDAGHATTEARLLLARTYYHSAQLRRAEQTAHEVIAEDPHDAYAHLLLARTLERQGRSAEAAPYRTLADLLGA